MAQRKAQDEVQGLSDEIARAKEQLVRREEELTSSMVRG